MITSRISAKGQVTLPSRIRKVLAVQPGDRVVFVVNGDSVALRSLGNCSARALAGSLRRYARGKADPAKIRQDVQRETAHAAAREG
jgi:AbrB family looped-hinge helix DNA binding protein